MIDIYIYLRILLKLVYIKKLCNDLTRHVCSCKLKFKSSFKQTGRILFAISISNSSNSWLLSRHTCVQATRAFRSKLWPNSSESHCPPCQALTNLWPLESCNRLGRRSGMATCGPLAHCAPCSCKTRRPCRDMPSKRSHLSISNTNAWRDRANSSSCFHCQHTCQSFPNKTLFLCSTLRLTCLHSARWCCWSESSADSMRCYFECPHPISY